MSKCESFGCPIFLKCREKWMSGLMYLSMSPCMLRHNVFLHVAAEVVFCIVFCFNFLWNSFQPNAVHCISKTTSILCVTIKRFFRTLQIYPHSDIWLFYELIEISPQWYLIILRVYRNIPSVQSDYSWC